MKRENSQKLRERSGFVRSTRAQDMFACWARQEGEAVRGTAHRVRREGTGQEDASLGCKNGRRQTGTDASRGQIVRVWTRLPWQKETRTD